MREFQVRTVLTRFTPDGIVKWVKEVENVFQDITEHANERSTIEAPFAGTWRNLLRRGAPTTAPVVGGAGPPPASGGVEFAYNYESSFSGGQTNLSPTVVVPDSAPFALSGAPSTDEEIDLVNVWRRNQGGSDYDWLRTDQVDNPDGVDWSSNYDGSLAPLIVSPVVPLNFEWPLWVVCGTGWYLRRVKIKWMGRYEQDLGDYWEFHLRVKKNGVDTSTAITSVQKTEGVVLSPRSVFSLPQVQPVQGLVGPDLDLLLEQDDTLLLSGRGIGTLDPLPDFFAQVSVVRRVP